MNFEGAVWVAESDGILKVATADGTILFEIPDAVGTRVVAVDTQRGVLWAYGKNHLSAFDFAGTMRVRVPLSVSTSKSDDDKDDHEDDGDEHLALVVDATDGSVWVGRHKTLYHFGANGTVHPALSLVDKIHALTFDPKRQWLWVSTERHLAAYDATLAIVATLGQNEKKKELQDIAFDSFLDQLWVATEHELRRYDMTGTATLIRSVREIEHIAVDGQGGIWMADEERVSHLDTSGRIESTMRLTVDKKGVHIVDLVADLSDRTAWVAGKKSLTQITPTGVILREVDLRASKVLKGNVRGLALYTDLSKPELTFDQPVPGSDLNLKQPSLVFSYHDIGLGVDPKTLVVIANGNPITVTCSTTDRTEATCLTATPFPEGSIHLSATVKDFAGNTSEPAETEFTVDTIAPIITLTHPTDGLVTNQTSMTITGALSEYANLTINNVAVNLGVGHEFKYGPVVLQEGLNRFNIAATDLAGNASQRSIQVTLDTVPPMPVIVSQISLSDLVDGKITVTGSAGSVEGSAKVEITNLRTGEKITVITNADGSFSAQIAVIAGDILSVSVVDTANNGSAAIEVRTGVASGVPPDPATIAPPLDPTVATTLSTATAFLYTGANPIQTGVVAGTINPVRVAVLRGKVLTRDNLALSGVVITIQGHPEFGQTLSRADGKFDLVVNGGGTLTINYVKQGYLPVQRQVNTPWNDYVIAPDVVIITQDSQVTTIDLNSPAVQPARGSISTDSDGTRQATMLFMPGTTATMVLPDGSTQPLSTLHVRATEYTVGPNGPKAMPATLPPTSGYTYAVELSVDEAVVAGAKTVQFNKPVNVYVENFLQFPVGGIVPVGYYDRDKSVWIPMDNGRIIKILEVVDGLTLLDVDGSNSAATPSALATLGITDDERRQLASLYVQGQSIWRSPVPHFSSIDLNWNYGLPEDAELPEDEDPEPEEDDVDSPDYECGSIIECQHQVLGESANITGVPFFLSYRSNRVPGNQAGKTLTIPLSGASIPTSLKRIELQIEIAGLTFTKIFPAIPNQITSFTWDGMDSYGRTLRGRQPVQVSIGYVYNARYLQPTPDLVRSFAALSASGLPISGDSERLELTLLKRTRSTLGLSFDAHAQGLGAWTLNVQHAYDPVPQTLHMGDGTQRRAENLGAGVIKTVAGNQGNGYFGDDGPATSAGIYSPVGVATDAEGNLFIADADNGRVRKVSPNGIITTVAGGGQYGVVGDGGPATSAYLGPTGIAVDTQGNLYISENIRIRKVSPNGIITTVAGNGQSGFSGDGGLATSAMLANAREIAVDNQGNLFIADAGNNRIRIVRSDGIISTWVGSGQQGFGGDGGQAALAKLNSPQGIVVDNKGNLFIADTFNNRIRRVSPSGIITTVAGNGQYGYGFDGELATSGRLSWPWGVTVDAYGSLFIAEYRNHRIRKVDSSGVITTVAGSGFNGYNGYFYYGQILGDGGPATAAPLPFPRSVAIDAAGSLFIPDSRNHIVRKVSFSLPKLGDIATSIVSHDGVELYEFDAIGRHIQTRNTLNGEFVYQFAYSLEGYLTRIQDGDGNVTIIERDSRGIASAIIAPDGQRTSLTMGSDGYLSAITNPANEATEMLYTADGLLTRFTKPRGNASTMTYDGLGRLVRDVNAAGGSWDLVRTESSGSFEVSMTSALGRQTIYNVESLKNGAERRINRLPDGTLSSVLKQTDGTTLKTASDGTFTTIIETTDPRFSMQAPRFRHQTGLLQR